MKNQITMNLRRFPVVVQDNRTGDIRDDAITLTKEQLQAAQIVGQSSTELIHRLFNRQGLKVLEIATPARRAITLDLDKLLERYDEEQDERNKWLELNGGAAD